MNGPAGNKLRSLELGDDRKLVDLSVLVGLQESLVVLKRHAAVRIAVGAKHERVRQQSRPPVDASLPDRIEAQRLHAVEGAFPQRQLVEMGRCRADRAFADVPRIVQRVPQARMGFPRKWIR